MVIYVIPLPQARWLPPDRQVGRRSASTRLVQSSCFPCQEFPSGSSLSAFQPGQYPSEVNGPFYCEELAYSWTSGGRGFFFIQRERPESGL